MTDGVFISAKLKVNRANQHITEFIEMLDAFLKTDFYRLTGDRDPNSGNYVVRFEYVTAPPIEIALVIGEAVHDLRSALDHMIWELAPLCGQTQTRDVSFPVSETKEKLEKVIENGKIKTLGTDFVDLFLNVIRPYKGGNDLLYGLHELDNLDKHRLLIPTYSIVALRGVSGRAGNITFEDNTFMLGENGVLDFLRVPQEIEFDNKGIPMLSVVFANGQPFEGQSIITILPTLSHVVTDIIQRVESTYNSRS